MSKSNRIVRRIQRAQEYYVKGDLSKSENEITKALKSIRKGIKNDFLVLEIGKVLNNLGAQHLSIGHFKKTVSLLRKALNLKRKVIGDYHESSIGTLKMLAESCIYACEFDLAKRYIEETLRLSQRSGDERLRKYGEFQKEKLRFIIGNRPPILVARISFAGDRYDHPLLESLYLPRLFDQLECMVDSLSVNLSDYETLECSMRFHISSKRVGEIEAIKDPYCEDRWKEEAPPPLRSRIPKSSDNFVVFLEDYMLVRRDSIQLVDDKGRKVDFELKSGLWDVFVPKSYPRFGHVHALSQKIPTCKRFMFFRGKGYVFRWKLDLNVTYKLKFVVDIIHTRDGFSTSTRIGLLFPFKFLSIQQMMESHLKELAMRSFRFKPIEYHKTREGAGIIPVRIDPSELSLNRVSNGKSYDLDRPLYRNDYSLLGLQLSYSLPEKLSIFDRIWDGPVPTGIYHTFVGSKEPIPLVNYRLVNNTEQEKKILLITEIENFTTKQRTTVSLLPRMIRNVPHFPPFIPEALKKLNETRVANIRTQALLLNGTEKILLDNTYPIRLLAYDTIIWQVTDPLTGVTEDLSRYVAAWITSHARGLIIDKLIREAAEFHPVKAMVGYQGADTPDEQSDISREQVKAIFNALKTRYAISYVSAPISFGTDAPNVTQRIKLPRDSIETRSANCIDGSVLFASALEHIGLNPVIVLSPGHAFVGWETWQNSGQYEFLETTMISTSTFEEALRKGAQEWANLSDLTPLKKKFLRIDLLRREGILPMEY